MKKKTNVCIILTEQHRGDCLSCGELTGVLENRPETALSTGICWSGSGNFR